MGCILKLTSSLFVPQLVLLCKVGGGAEVPGAPLPQRAFVLPESRH